MPYTYRSETVAGLAELAGKVAHELNNIFTAISGNLSLLGEELGATGSAAETIDELMRTSEQGIALSERLQAFAGRQPLKRQRVEIGRILAESAEELRAVFPTLDVTLSLPARPAIVFIDEAKMRATLRELASNAAAATDGHGRLCLFATLQSFVRDNRYGLRSGSYVEVQVADNGPGMEGETARRAVQPAFSTRSSSINAGWGLSKCIGFIHQCGGMTRLSTAPDHGTIVQMFLPLEISHSGVSADTGTEPITSSNTHFPAQVRPVVFFY